MPRSKDSYLPGLPKVLDTQCLTHLPFFFHNFLSKTKHPTAIITPTINQNQFPESPQNIAAKIANPAAIFNTLLTSFLF